MLHILIVLFQAVSERGCPDPAFAFAKHLLETAFDGELSVVLKWALVLTLVVVRVCAGAR